MGEDIAQGIGTPQGWYVLLQRIHLGIEVELLGAVPEVGDEGNTVRVVTRRAEAHVLPTVLS
jgi:hypothetical protein